MKKFAVIGCPVEHSLSPVMHNAGYKAAGINAEYERLLIQPESLGQAVKELKSGGYSGWNVTFPFKEQIIPYLDKVTEQAQRIGAVNTVKVDAGSLIGYNTDGEGFVKSVENNGFNLRGKKVIILGAGGAAKAIAFSLISRKAEIVILNRTPSKAEKLAEILTSAGGKASWGSFQPGGWLSEAELLIQTTSIGLRDEEFPFSLRGINPAALVIDLIYNPPVTKFLREAKRYGCKVMNGLEMLLYQGVLAWEIWFDQEAPVAAMKNALLEKTVTNWS